MSIEFKLPSIGEGVTSADVAQIMVQPGDSISAGWTTVSYTHLTLPTIYSV